MDLSQHLRLLDSILFCGFIWPWSCRCLFGFWNKIRKHKNRTKNVFFVFFQSLLFEFQLLFSLFVFSSTVYHHELKCVDKQAYVKSTLIWTEKEDVHHLKVSILSYVIWNENEKEKWHCKQKLLLGIDDLSVWLLLLFTECVPSSCADLNKLYICILYILYKMLYIYIHYLK